MPPKQLRIAILELLVMLAKAGDFSGADEGEILGPEEVDLPLAFVAFIR